MKGNRELPILGRVAVVEPVGIIEVERAKFDENLITLAFINEEKERVALVRLTKDQAKELIDKLSKEVSK